MTWLTSGLRLRPSTAGALCLAFALTASLVPATRAEAQPSAPAELDYICVERDDKVRQANSPADCGRREVVVDVPAQRPVHLCGRDDFGQIRYTTDPNACTRDHEFLITIPDDGPIILCSKNIKNGRVQDSGELRYADNVARCDSKFYSPFITPAAPNAFADSYSVDEDTLLTVAAGGVLDNDADASGGPLTARLVQGTTVGTVALNADGGFTYDPRGLFDDLDIDQSRDVSFSYATSDGELESEPATVTITVAGRNDRPVASDDTYTIDEDSVLQVTRPGVLDNDTDAEVGTLTSVLVDDVATGQLDLATDGGFRYDPRGAFDHLGTGQPEDVTFTYTARDGSDDADSATVTLTVTGINDAPVAAADTFTTDENTPLDITTAQLLANDNDVEGTALTVVDVIAGSPVSAFTVHPDGSVTFDPTVAFNDLEDGQTGTASFSYAASDGEALSARTTVTIAVTGISGPSAVDDTASTDEDSIVEIDILGNDTVAGADVTITSQGARGGAVTFANGVAVYDPNGAFDDLRARSSRLDVFTYQLSNVEGSSEGTVQVIVEGRNDAPVATDDGVGTVSTTEVTTLLAAQGVLANDADADRDPPDTLTAILVSPPERGRLTLSPDGAIRFDPAGELTQGEAVTFRYRIDDGTEESATATVTLDTQVDFPPVFSDQQFLLLTDANPAQPVAQIVATDREGGHSLALAQSSTYFAVAADGTITLLQGIPPLGAHPLQVIATDGAGQTTAAIVTVRVLVRFDPMDDTFRAIGNTPLYVGVPAPANAIAVLDGPGLLFNDGDPNAIRISPTVVTTSLGGSADIAADGTFTYVPPRPNPGGGTSACDPSLSTFDGVASPASPASDTFTYDVIDDETGNIATATATIQIPQVVWYVDLTLGPGTGCGTAQDPYGDTAALDGSGADDTTDDVIYLLDGAGGSPLTLQDGQQLLGAGVDLAPAGVPLITGDPAVQPTHAGAVTLAEDNTLAGFTISGAQKGVLTGSSGTIGDLSIDLDEVTVNTAPALSLGSGDAQVTIGSLSSPGSLAGVQLSDTAGTVTLGTLTLNGPVQLSGTGGSVPDATVALGSTTIGGGIPADPADAAAGGSTGGLLISGWDGDIDVDTLDVRITDTPTGQHTVLGANSLPDGATLDIGRLTSIRGTQGIRSVDNEGAIFIDDAVMSDVDMSATPNRGLLAQNNNGSIVVNDGIVTADTPATAGPAPILFEVRDGTGSTRNDAALQLGDPAAGPSATAARSFMVSQLDSGAEVQQNGMVTSRGGGILLRGNQSDSLVTMTSGSDIQTTPYVDETTLVTTDPDNPIGVAFYAQNATVGLTGAGHLFSSDRGPALRLVNSQAAADGIQVTSALSTGAAYAENSQSLVGIGIDLLGVTAGGPVAISAGQVQQPAVLGIRVQNSPAVTVGAVTVTEPLTLATAQPNQVTGVGVSVVNSDQVILRGTQIQRATSDGIRAAGQRDLTLDNVTVNDSNATGVRLPDPEGTTILTGTTISSSQLEGLHISDSGVLGEQMDLQILNTGINGSPAEVDSTRITATTGSDVKLTVGGTTSSALAGGRHSMLVDADGGATVDVAVSRTIFASSSRDGLRLSGTGTGTSLTFQLTDLTAETQGGLVNNGESGLTAIARDNATVTGVIERVESSGSGDYGILLDHADGTRLDRVTVGGADQVSIGVQNTADVTIERADVIGAPQGHGIELWGAKDVVINDSRVDFRNLPDPPGPDLNDDGEPKPDHQQTIRRLDSAAGTCTNTNRQGESGIVLGRIPPLVVDGVSGIFARHTTGDLTITNTTVRGASLHQVTVFNGTAVQPITGPFGNQVNSTSGNTVPGVVDPAPRPTPRFGTAGVVNLVIGALETLDNDPNRAGLFAGAGLGGRATIDYLPLGAAEVVDAHLFCSTDGGVTTVTGSPQFIITTLEPGIILKASGGDSKVNYDLRNVTISYDLEVRNVFFDLIQSLGLDHIFALQVITEDGGVVEGSLENLTVENAPGNAVRISDSGGEHGPFNLSNPNGHGIVVDGASNTNINTATITTPGLSGVRVVDSSNVAMTTITVTEPTEHGVVVDDSDVISVVGLTVTDPGAEAVQGTSTAGLAIRQADLTTTAAGSPAPRSGVLTRNVLPVEVTDALVSGFDLLPIDIASGADHPDVAELSTTALPCGDTPPCTGTVTLGSIETVGTPSGQRSVLVRHGTDVQPTVDLADAPASTRVALDSGLEISSVDSDVTVTASDATFTTAGAGGGVLIDSVDGSPLTANLGGLDLTHSGSGNALTIRESTSTTLTNPDISGGTGDAVNVPDGTLTIAGGTLAGVGGNGVTHTGGSLTISGLGISSPGGTGILGTAAGGGSPAASITGGTITDAGADGINLTGYDTALVTGGTIDDPTSAAVRIAASADVDIEDLTVEVGTEPPVNASPFAITGTGIAGQCTFFSGNQVNGDLTANAYVLNGLGLEGYRQGTGNALETVAAWLDRNTNSPNTVEDTNVISC